MRKLQQALQKLLFIFGTLCAVKISHCPFMISSDAYIYQNLTTYKTEENK